MSGPELCYLSPQANFPVPQTEGRAFYSSGNSEPVDCVENGCGLLFVTLSSSEGEQPGLSLLEPCAMSETTIFSAWSGMEVLNQRPLIKGFRDVKLSGKTSVCAFLGRGLLNPVKHSQNFACV